MADLAKAGLGCDPGGQPLKDILQSTRAGGGAMFWEDNFKLKQLSTVLNKICAYTTCTFVETNYLYFTRIIKPVWELCDITLRIFKNYYCAARP